MKTSQCIAYAERITRVIALLDRSEPDALPSLEAVAAEAALSPFHFHRIFRLMTGETPAEAIRRIRLAHALPALTSETRVTEAAESSGMRQVRLSPAPFAIRPGQAQRSFGQTRRASTCSPFGFGLPVMRAAVRRWRSPSSVFSPFGCSCFETWVITTH